MITIPHNLIVIQTTWNSAATLIQLQAHRHQFDKLVAKLFSRGENGLAAGLIGGLYR